jgi:hypothetical protein
MKRSSNYNNNCSGLGNDESLLSNTMGRKKCFNFSQRKNNKHANDGRSSHGQAKR